MKITIIGTDYVGLVTGTCLADFSLSVTCVDQDETKISLLNIGESPSMNPILPPLSEKTSLLADLPFPLTLKKQ